MTVLDRPTRRPSKRQARRAAVRAARRLRRQVHKVALASSIAGGVLLATGALGSLLGLPQLMLAWPVAVLALAVAWAAVDAVRRPPPDPAGIPLHVLIERRLHQHLAVVASRLGTQAPTEVWLVPEPVLRFDPDPDTPVLYLGAPVLWHLEVDELDRLLAGELVMMSAVLDPELRPGMLLAARLDAERLTSDSTPLVGTLVRRWGRALEASRSALLEAARDWADSTVPSEARPTEADRARLAALAEVGELVQAQRTTAAAEGLGVAALGAHTAATVAACEEAGVLEPDAHLSAGPVATDLLTAPVATDDRLATHLAAAAAGPDAPVVQWDQLPQRAWLPRWRSQRDGALPAVHHVTGVWPSTLRGMLDTLQPPGDDGRDLVAELGALLARHPEHQLGTDAEPAEAPEGSRLGDPGTGLRHAAVTEAISAAVRVSAVEQDCLSLTWDDAWGAQVVDPQGEAVLLEAFVADGVARRAADELIGWVAELGLDVDTPWIGAGEPKDGVPGLPIAAFPARTHGRRTDLVLMDGWILSYPHPRRNLLGSWRDRLRPAKAATDELLALAEGHRAELSDVADQATSCRLVDVIAARMSAPVHGLGWELELELPDRTLRLSGAGTGRDLAAAIADDLGTRLVRTGTNRVDRPVRSWAGRGWWLGGRAAAAACLALAGLVLAGIAGLEQVAGVHPVTEATTLLALGVMLGLAASVGYAEAARRFEDCERRARLPAPSPLRFVPGQRTAEG